MLYSDISNFTFWNVNILKCKIFLIDFLDEFGNFKQKKFYTSKCNFFTFYSNGPIVVRIIFKMVCKKTPDYSIQEITVDT